MTVTRIHRSIRFLLVFTVALSMILASGAAASAVTTPFSTDPRITGAVQSLGEGILPWRNLGNLLSADDYNSAATAAATGTFVSDYLFAAGFGFTTDMFPVDAVITGIEFVVVRAYYSNSAAAIRDNSVRLHSGSGTFVGDDRADKENDWSPNLYPSGGVFATRIYGGPTDLWGLTGIAPSDVADPNFGVGISVASTDSSPWTMPSAYVDSIKMKVYFTVDQTSPVLVVANPHVTYDGTTQSANVYATANGTAVTGVVSDVKYDGLSAAPTTAGVYAVTADFAPSDKFHYASLDDAPAGTFSIDAVWPKGTRLSVGTVTSSSVTLVLNQAVTGADTYVVYYGSSKQEFAASAGTSLTVAGLIPYTTYTFTVQAVVHGSETTNGPSKKVRTKR